MHKRDREIERYEREKKRGGREEEGGREKERGGGRRSIPVSERQKEKEREHLVVQLTPSVTCSGG